MSNTMLMSSSWRRYLPVLLLLALVALLMLPDLAHAASDNSEGSGLPFEAPLQKLLKTIRGPVAFAISLIGIVAAGAVLIFGGEMSGFLRTMVFLVLVIAIIVNASGLIGIMSGDGASVAITGSQIEGWPGTYWSLG